MLLGVVNVLFLYIIFNFVVDVSGDKTEKRNENNPPSKEKKEPSPDKNKDVYSTPLIEVEPTWNKKMDDFKLITFDLTQEAGAQYTQSEAMRTLEAVKGLEYSQDNMVRFKIWPQGVIPFFIDEFSYDKILSDKIRNYLDATNRLTGLRFVELPRPPEDPSERWIFFVNRRQMLDCYNYDKQWGSQSGIQRVIVGYDCLGNGGHMASLVLTMLSIAPQHVSPDRDKFVQVFEENCWNGPVSAAGQYDVVTPQNWLFHDIEYDFLSAGHQSYHKCTSNGKATIKPLETVKILVGETKGFSFTDVYKIRRLYNAITMKENKQHQLSNCRKIYRPKNNTESVVDGNEPSMNLMNLNEVSQTNHVEKLKLKMKKRIRLPTEDPLKWPDIHSDE